jgi:hypothetical protein
MISYPGQAGTKEAILRMDEFPGNPPNPPLSKGGRGGISEICCHFGRKIISKRQKTYQIF